MTSQLISLLSSVAIAVFAAHATTVEGQTCSNEDISFPRGRRRVCKIYPQNVQWLSRCDQNSYKDYSSAPSCQAYVGMTLVAYCQSQVKADQRLQVLRKNQILNNTGTIVIYQAQSSDSSSYECRTLLENGTIVSSFSFNITISDGTAIGIGNDQCLTSIYYNSTYNCCHISRYSAITFRDDDVGGSFSLDYYGARNVSLSVEWLTPSKQHYPTAIDFSISTSNKTFSITIEEFPAFLNSDLKLRLLAIITVTGSTVSRSLCTPILLIGSSQHITLFVNTSLPEPAITEEGDTAIFECHFRSPRHECNEWHVFEYYQNEETSIPHQFSQFCDQHYEDYSIVNGSYTLNVSVSIFGQLERSYHYRYYIHDVSIRNNNSYWACLLYSNGKIQWQGNALLFVSRREGGVQMSSPAILETNGASNNSNTAAAIVIPVVLLILIAATIVVPIGVCYYISRRSSIRQKFERRVPLIKNNSEIINSMTSSTSDMDYEQGPGVQVTENEHFQKDGGMGDTNTTGLLKIESAAKLSGKLGMTSLEMEYLNPSRDLLPGDGNVVYISYTDKKADWVYSYLKPLLESWDCQVILHEEDMIPGFSVSGERQRLILQAHRVVLVVSPDYSTSPWCLYELQHAITKEPVLFRGKIIPIMVDGCNTLPVMMKGVVPLHESENFEKKLKKNICGSTG